MTIEDDWLEEVAELFDPIILREDGSVNLTKLYLELGDYYYMMMQANKVYDYVTCGKAKDPRTRAQDVIDANDQCMDREIRAAVNAVLDRLQDGETIDELRDEYPRPDA